MADLEFNTTAGQTVDRALLIAYLNTGTSEEPVWSALGTRTDDSSEEYDWERDTTKDILGNTWSTMKRPTITQTFDPVPVDAGDAAIKKIWNLAVKDQDAQSLSAMDMLIAHYYVDASDNNFAERYTGCSIEVTSLGGEGGGSIGMPFDVTYGGTRKLGKVTKTSAGVVTFTPDGV